MALLQSLYGNPIVHGIGWTLLHACWQITLVALVLRALLPSLERKSASTLYLAGVLSLMIITIWSAFTFWHQFQYFEEAITIAQFEPQYNNTSSVAITPQHAETIVVTPSPEQEESTTDWMENLLYYLPILVVLWFAGILLLLFRLLFGWLRIYHLRTQGLRVIEEQWLKRFAELKHTLGIRHPVHFFLSEKVTAPLTLGFFKPMVLVPIGLFANLSPEMVEMVLLHELAHIKRADYLVNILQSLVEMTFFFHPAIWWIAKIIRVNREHACDDIAVAACEDPMLYAQTLTSLQSNILTTNNNLAMSLTGTTGSFTTRIKRLFGYAEPTVSKNKSVLFSSLLFTCLLCFAFVDPFGSEHYSDQRYTSLSGADAVMYVITPSTTQRQLKEIKSSLADKQIQVNYSNLKYTAFGLVENIRIDFELADTRTFMIEAGRLQYIHIVVDPSKKNPLDVRFSCSSITLSPPEKGNEEAWAMSRPYTNNFSIPSFIGDIAFQEQNDQKVVMKIPEAVKDFPAILLNEEEVSKEELLAKQLRPVDIKRILKLSPQQAEDKFSRSFPNGAYEVTAKLNAQGERPSLFSVKGDPNTQFYFKVLHKAEMRNIGKSVSLVSGRQDGFSISSDNCEDDNKALHVLNDRTLEVPDGACYPPELLALSEVDSFFLYDTDLAMQQFGTSSAYVFYYRYGKDEEQQEKEEPGIFAEQPKNPVNRAIMYDIKLEDISHAEEAPLCLLNEKILDQNVDGTWPEELTQYEVFDSVVILMSADAKQAFGLTGKNHPLLFYASADQQEESTTAPASRASRKKDQTLFPNALKAQIQLNPNPFRERLTINLALFNKALVKVQIHDQSGRLITDLTEETLGKGYHTFYWTPATSITSGTYYVSVQKDKEFTSLPVIYQGGH